MNEHNDRALTPAQKEANRTALHAKRIILVTGYIDEDLAADVLAQLAALEAANDSKEITVMVDSYGGSVYSTNAIVSAMQACSAPVNTVCRGKAMSGGFSIFMAGIKRSCSDWATFMAHCAAFTNYHRKTSDLEGDMTDIKGWYARSAAFWEGRTKKPAKFWLDIFESGKDTFFNAEDAKKAGIVNA